MNRRKNEQSCKFPVHFSAKPSRYNKEATHWQKGLNKSKISKAFQTLQIYSAKQLGEILQKNGFEILLQCGMDGTKLNEATTDRIVTIARRKITNDKHTIKNNCYSRKQI
jgi:hypothetical protein